MGVVSSAEMFAVVTGAGSGLVTLLPSSEVTAGVGTIVLVTRPSSGSTIGDGDESDVWPRPTTLRRNALFPEPVEAVSAAGSTCAAAAIGLVSSVSAITSEFRLRFTQQTPRYDVGCAQLEENFPFMLRRNNT